MLFTSLVSTLATAGALLVPMATATPVGANAVVGEEFNATAEAEVSANAGEGVSAMAWDFQYWNYGRRGCAGGHGPRRELLKGVCSPVASTTKAIRVLDHRVGHKIRGYPNGDCKGNPITAFSSHQCHNLDGVWSIRVGTA